jgi:G3E family GTPase
MDQRRTPVGIITGFLGAGKTTLLNRLLHDPALNGTIVIVNEFGEVGLDHLFLESRADGEMVLLSSGCLCCTVRGDLVATLEDLFRARDEGSGNLFHRILIETTGLADPVPVMQAVLAHPWLSRLCELAGIITLADATQIETLVEEHEEALKQIVVADRIVLTKTDLWPANERAQKHAEVVKSLRLLNPIAPILDVAPCDASLIIEAGLFGETGKRGEVRQWLDEEALGLAAHDHHHDPNRHGDVKTFAIVRDQPIDPGSLDLFLGLLRQTQGAKLLRMKGLVQLSNDAERPLLLQAVQHVLHPPEKLAQWPDQDRRTRLVFIGRGLDETSIRAMFDALTGTPRIDTPDRAALEDNPLSLRRG